MAESGFKCTVSGSRPTLGYVASEIRRFHIIIPISVLCGKSDDLAALSPHLAMIPKGWRNDGCSPVSAHIPIFAQPIPLYCLPVREPFNVILALLPYSRGEGKWKIPELKDTSKGFGIPSVLLYHNTCHHWPCMRVTVNLDLGFQTKTSLQNSWKSQNYNRSYII